MTRRLVLTAAALVAVVLGGAAPPALASSPYDGTWIVDFPASPTVGGRSEPVCPALRLRAEVKDGQISGSLARFFPGNVVENDQGSAASPVTGTVHPDGSVEAYWLGWIVKGQITGERAQLTLLYGQCGPRHMTGIRVRK
ncbi:MAG TPA: hypothetical protein VMU87_20595 [Stellaceae bacterium]|nr:hypothetical protein [Stellaceae bacterium]